ncbi:MAG: nuclear transport factor 2 family protein, partial [Xanthobacteraceae bacterium]
PELRLPGPQKVPHACVSGNSGFAFRSRSLTIPTIMDFVTLADRAAGVYSRATASTPRGSTFLATRVGLVSLRSSSGTHKGAKAMSQDESNADKIRIKALLEGWADAVRRHDLSAILAHHELDMVMFDLPPPLQCKGIEAYKDTWDLFFRYHKPRAAFDIQELAITAGQDVAFAVAIMHCGPESSSNPADKDGFLFRLTVGLRKVEGRWRIAHEHHSIPAAD